MERQDLSCTYLAHHESIQLIFVIVIVVITISNHAAESDLEVYQEASWNVPPLSFWDEDFG